MNAVSKNLRELRAAAGLTQDALAERLHVTRQTISNRETGRSEPDLQALEELALALTSAAEFLIWQFFYPDLGRWNPIFNFPPEYYSLFVYILPFLGGIGIFLGCNRK